MDKKFEVHSISAEQTKELGSCLAKLLNPGDVLLLLAGLGSGKTTMVQGLVKTLKVNDDALSPTFIIAQTFEGKRGKKKIPVHHLDFYRMDKREILAMGIEDYLVGQGAIEKGVVIIEWADVFKEIWPKDHLEIQIQILPRSKTRKITLIAKGKHHQDLLKKVKRKYA